MPIFSLGSPVRHRVWLDDLPDATYRAEEMRSCVDVASPSRLVGNRRVAIEYRGPPWLHDSSYGLLGGSFSPDQAGRLVVRLAIADAPGDTFADALPQYWDEARIGLPRYFADAVCASASRFAVTLGSGTLTLDHAVQGIVRSSPVVFFALTRSVCHLMAQEPHHPINTDVERLWRESLDAARAWAEAIRRQNTE